MEPDDLVADGKADAAAARLGGALVELLLDEGQLLRRDTGSVVAHADNDIVLLGARRNVHTLAGAAVLAGVVQHVGKDLLHALTVGCDGRDLFLARIVADLDALLAKQLAIGVNSVLQLGNEVDRVDAEREAAVLDLREIEQLLHHGGETARLLADDGKAAASLLRVADGVGLQRLRPAVDGGERRAQLVGNGGDELLLDLLRLGDLERHIVDVVHQLAQLVPIAVVDADAVASAGDAPRRVRHDGDGLDHAVDEQHVGDQDQYDRQQREPCRDEEIDEDLMLHRAQAGHIAQHAHDTRVEHKRAGDGKDALSRLWIAPLKMADTPGDGALDVLRTRRCSGGQSIGRRLNTPVRVDELQFQLILVRKGLHRIGRKPVILAVAAHTVTGKRIGRDACARLQIGEHTAVIILRRRDGKNRHRQNQQNHHRQRSADQPALPQAADAEALPYVF